MHYFSFFPVCQVRHRAFSLWKENCSEGDRTKIKSEKKFWTDGHPLRPFRGGVSVRPEQPVAFEMCVAEALQATEHLVDFCLLGHKGAQRCFPIPPGFFGAQLVAGCGGRVEASHGRVSSCCVVLLRSDSLCPRSQSTQFREISLLFQRGLDCI